MSARPRRLAVTLASVAASALTSIGMTATPALAAPTEHITNGTFTSTTDPWWGTDNLSIAVSSGRLCTQVPSDTVEVWDAIVGYTGIPLVKGDVYTVKFDASASVATTIKANVQLAEDPYTATMSRDTALTSSMKSFTYTFTSTLDADAGAFQFQIGGATKAWRFCVDNVSVKSEPGSTDPNGPEQVRNGTFDEGASGWFSYETGTPTITSGRLCSVVPSGLANPWDAGIGQNDIPLIEGESYTFSFEASSNPAASVRATVQLGEDPYTAYFGQSVSLSTSLKKYTYTFTASETTDIGQVAFQLGGSSKQHTFCVDNVSLRGGE